jgi:hypothetical protein
MTTDEQADLENLVKSPGWLRFVDAQQTYWRDTLSQAIGVVASDRDDQIALQKIRQVIAAQRAVQQALSWPAEQLSRQQVKEQRHEPSLSRGGFR